MNDIDETSTHQQVGDLNTDPAYPATPSQGGEIMAVVAQAAADPEYPVERLATLIDLRNDEIARLARLDYFSAMARTQAEIGPIAKNKENTHTKSFYSDLAAINAEVVPVYTRHGFGISFSNKPAEIADHIVIMADVMHQGGHTEHFEYLLPYDGAGAQGRTNKTPIHASASTVTYGQRYLTCQIFNIATTDDDGVLAGAQSQEPASSELIEQIVQGCEITGKTADECVAYVNTVFATEYDRVTQFTTEQAQRMLAKLNRAATALESES